MTTTRIATPVLMIEPSSWLRSGIRIEKVNDINLVKFTNELQFRLEELLEKQKAVQLTPEEEVEYAGISELEKIITFINAQLIAYQTKQIDNPWIKFAGVFKDDPDFAEIVEELKAERNIIDDDLENEDAK